MMRDKDGREWKLVTVEASPEMIKAAGSVEPLHSSFGDIWAAMFAASPDISQGEAEPVAWLVELYSTSGEHLATEARTSKPIIGSTARTVITPLYRVPPDTAAIIARLEQRVAEAELVMKPFMEFVDDINAWRHEDDSTCIHRIKAADLRNLKKWMEAKDENHK